MHAPPLTLFTFYLTFTRMSYRTIYCPSPFVAWSSTFKCYYKTTLLSISLLCVISSLQQYIALVGFALTTTRAHCTQGQTDTSASQGTQVSDDNLSANSIHIQLLLLLLLLLLFFFFFLSKARQLLK